MDAIEGCLDTHSPDAAKIIVKILLEKGKTTIYELATLMGASYNYVRLVVSALNHRGIVKLTPVRNGRPGRPQYEVTLDKEKLRELVRNCIQDLETFMKSLE